MKTNTTVTTSGNASKKEVFGHAVAGFGQNLIYGFWSGYTMVFFTDVFGIAASAAGLIVLASRIWDAINDPMMGAIADRTRTRWGRYRPWLLFMSLPIVIFLTLNFSTPNLSGSAKVAYAAVTYILMSMAFTGVDVPYWTLPSAMSSDTNQRGSIFATSRLSTTLSSLLVSVIAVPIITAFSKNGMAAGYRNAALIFGCAGAALYLVGFFFIREHIAPAQKQKFSLSSTMMVIVKNKPLLLTLAAFILINTANYIRSGMSIYYAVNNLGSMSLVPILSLVAIPGMVIGMMLTPVLMRKFDKRNLFIAFCLAGAVLYFIYFLYGYKNLTLVLAFNAIAPIPLGSLSILASTMISSTIEYVEWKTGQRNEGIISSSQTFSSKVCIAIGGGISGLILTLSNYVPNQQQAVSTLNIFHGTLTLVPTVLFLIAIVPMLFFDLTNKRYAEIVEELKQRRAAQTE